MSQLFTGLGSGIHGSSWAILGSYGPKGTARLGQGGGSLYVNAANGNLLLKQSDGFLANSGPNVDLFQSYNSRDTNAWRFNTDTHLSLQGVPNTTGSCVTRTDEDGHRSGFHYDKAHHAYLADDGRIAKFTFDGRCWAYCDGNSPSILHYNQDGQLIDMSDRDGHKLAFTYQDGHLTSVTDNSKQQQITWSYRQGLLCEVTVQSADKTVHHLHYDYDAQHRLTRISRDFGDGTHYWVAYDYVGESNLMADIRQSDGTTMHMDYDAQGRIKRLIDGEGQSTSYEYLTGCTRVTNGAGDMWTYAYDSEARLTGIDGPNDFHLRYVYDGTHLASIHQGNQHWLFRYNEAGDCIRTISPDGQVIARTFDDEHHLLSETRYHAFDDNNLPIKPETARFLYDEKGHLRFEMTADGVVTEYRYDVSGNRISRRCYLKARWQSEMVTLDAVHQWCQNQTPHAISLVDYRYDWRGCLSEEIHYTQINEEGNGLDTPDTLRTYSQFDAAGRLVEQSTGRGHTYYIYDDLGRLIKTIDSQGHAQTIDYDDAHQRILKTDPSGLQTLNVYDKRGLLLSTHRLDSRHDYGTISYAYDAAGRLISETDTTGQTRYLRYDAQGRLQSTVSAAGHVMEYTYDPEGRCIQTREYNTPLNTQALGDSSSTIKPISSTQDRITQRVYNERNQLARQIDAFGSEVAYVYDAQGRLITKTAYANQSLIPSPDDKIITYYYDAEGRLLAEVNGEGAAIAYQYDAEGHLIERIQYQNIARNPRTGDWILDAPTPQAHDIHTYATYNAAGLKTADIDGSGYRTEYTYDARGLLIEKTASSIRTTYRYNDLDQLVEQNTHGLCITWDYNEQGLVSRETRSNGDLLRSQDYRYDALGRMIQHQDALGVEQFAYDVAGNLISKTNAQGACTRYVYNDAGLLTFTISPVGGVTETRYNAFQQIEATHRYATFHMIDATLDDIQQFLQTYANPDADAITHYAYDARGLLVREIHRNPSGHDKVLAYTYDAFGRKSSATLDPDGLRLTTMFAYDANDNVIRLTDANQHTTHYVYDAMNRARFRIDACGVVMEHQFDENGHEIQTITYGTPIALAASYDESSLSELIQPDSSTDHQQFFRFDAEGHVLCSYDGLGYATAYTYDVHGNVITKTCYATPCSMAALIAGEIPVLSANARTTYFEYDGLNQLRFQTDAMGHVTEFRYNAAGLLIQKTRFADSQYVPNPECDETHHYQYDVLGRLIAEASPEGIVTTFEFDAAGNQITRRECAIRLTPESFDTPNWLNAIQESLDDRITRMQFDAACRETHRISPTGVIRERRYDAVGNVINDIMHTEGGRTQVSHYEYDVIGRLVIQTDATSHSTQYEYDKNNNVVSKTDANYAVWTYEYNAVNQCIATRSPITAFSTYKNGSWFTETRSVITTHAYDSFGNLVREVRDAGGINQVVQYTYDANNRRVQTIYPDVSVNSAALKASNVRQETTKSLSESYVYNAFGELIEQRDRAGISRFFSYDDAGQQTQTVDACGYVTQYDYDAFGNVLMKTQCAAASLIIDSHDRHTYYTYDKDHRLTQTTQDAVRHYNPRTGEYQITRPTTRLTYNAFGDVLTQAVRLHETDWSITTHAYDHEGRLRSTLNSEQYLTEYRYNAAGLLTDEVQYAIRSPEPRPHADDRHVSFQYDAGGHLIQKTLHQVTYQRLTDNGSKTQTETADLTSRYAYDAMGNLISTTDAQGHTAYSYYSALGQLTAKIGMETQSGRTAMTYGYDALGELVECHQWAQGAMDATIDHYTLNAATANDIIQHNIYDARGYLIQTTDGTGHIIHYSVDAAGNIVRAWQMLNQANGTSLLLDTRYTYDRENRLIQTAILNPSGIKTTDDAQYNAFGEVVKKGVNGQFTTYVEFDALGRVCRSTSDGQVHVYEYNLTTNVTRMQMHGIDVSDDSPDVVYQESTYDALGRLVKQSQDARVITTQTFDCWGNVLSHTNARGYMTRNTYNALNVLTEQTLPEVVAVDKHGVKHTIAPVNRYAVDSLGRIIAMTDANGHTITHQFDAEGRDIQLTDATGRHRSKIYNLLGQLTTQTNERGVITRYTYDAANRLLSVSTPQTTQTYTYDGAGHILHQTDIAGNTQTFAYDEQGDLIEKTVQNATTRYAYDDVGHKTAEIDANGNQASWAYDERGHLSEHTDFGGHRTTYHYTSNGLLANEKGSTGKELTYQYDRDGQLIHFEDRAHQESVDYTYDAEGHILSKISARLNAWGSETDLYDYDALGRLIKIRRTATNGADLLSVDYEFDAVGNVRDSITEAHYSTDTRRQTDYFRYDDNNRLVINKGQLINGEIDISSTQGTALAYDEVGNVVDVKTWEGGAAQHYTYHYNSDNLLEITRKNERDFQSRRYEAGLLREETLYNDQGIAAQYNTLLYTNGRLSGQTTFDATKAVGSKSSYAYDNVGNLTTLTIQSKSLVLGGIDVETHDYTYERWDSYLQKADNKAYDSYAINRRLPKDAKHRIILYSNKMNTYDNNGALQETTNSNTPNNSTKYVTSAIDGIRIRKNNDSQTQYLTTTGKTLGDVRIDNQKKQFLTVYSGVDKPDTQQDNLGAYCLSLGDTLEGIALQVYGDSSLWYLIAEANGITDRHAKAGEKDSELHVGLRLNIPPISRGQHQTNATKKIMSNADWTTDSLDPDAITQPLHTPAPAQSTQKNSHGFWKTIAKIAVMVTATVAMVMSAGALAIFAGATSAGGLGGLITLGLNALSGGAGISTTATLITGFSAGFASSIAGQAAANALNLQHGIDMKGALLTGLGTAATAGVSQLLSSSAAYSSLHDAMDAASTNAFSITNAVEMMERDAISQGLNLAFTRHQHLDWLELGTTAATAGVMGSQKAQDWAQTLKQKIGRATAFANSELQALATGAATGHFDAKQILQDNLGNAISSTLLQPTGIPADQPDLEEGGYCTIPTDETYSPIPEGTWERFQREETIRRRLDRVVGRNLNEEGDGRNRNAINLVRGEEVKEVRSVVGFDSKINIVQLATLLMSEASVGNYAEQVAVGSTVINRMYRNNTTNVSDVWSAYAHNQIPSHEMLELSANLLTGKILDNTKGATHYYSPRSMPKKGFPTEGFDIGGGLERISGRATENYKPSFANLLKYVDIPDVREGYYKFYFVPGKGKVR